MKRATLLFYILFALFLLYNLITLSISPIIWTDEVCFASVTTDFIRHHTFYFTADLSWVQGRPVLSYGPIYFILNGLSYLTLGNNIFAGRLVGLLAGFILLTIICYKWKNSTDYFILLLFLCFLTDEFFISSMHRGRNDTLSILFYYTSLFTLAGNPFDEKTSRREITSSRALLAAILLALSFLTSVRIFVLTVPFAIIFLVRWWQASFKMSFVKIPFIFGVTILVLYLPWVYWGFGGIKEYQAFYQYIKDNFPYFVTSWFRIPKEVSPLFLLSAVACIIGGVFAGIRKNIWYILVVSIMFSYFIFVGDTGAPVHTHKYNAVPYLGISLNDSGPYFILILPALYILIALCLYQLSSFPSTVKWVLRVGVILLLIFNIGLFALKNIVLAAQAQARSISKLNEFIHSNIPAGGAAKVCADEVYYYSVINNGNPYHMMISYQSDVVKTEDYSRNIFNYDYLIISKRLEDRNPKLIHQYLSEAKLEEVADYNSIKSSVLTTIVKKLRINIPEESYDGIIYKRIRN